MCAHPPTPLPLEELGGALDMVIDGRGGGGDEEDDDEGDEGEEDVAEVAC